MKNAPGGKSVSAPAPAQSREPIQPSFPPLPQLPESLVELFRSLALTQRSDLLQPFPKGLHSPKKQSYALPWVGFKSWKDARERLEHFEKKFISGTISWAPFNDNESNDGPMSLNAYPGRALIERVTNEGDANLERAALTHVGPLPKSPAEAAKLWFNLGPGALANGLDNVEARNLA